MFFHRCRPSRLARVALATLVPMMLFSISAPTQAQINSRGDYGDAPDTTNHFGLPMYAYPDGPAPRPEAHYPTVVDIGAGGPHGPWHRNPSARSWLGSIAGSEEANADQAPDADGTLNIRPVAGHQGHADYDRGDGHTLPTGVIDLPECALTTFTYGVSGAAGVPGHYDYFNAWFDFNEDGDWEDSFGCVDASGISRTVTEWAVQNQVVAIGAGANILVTPWFTSAHSGSAGRLWMRLTLSEVAVASSFYDGSGPPTGYQFGESSDILLRPTAPASKQTMQAANGGASYAPEVSYYHTY
jgi:hypothetical protein